MQHSASGTRQTVPHSSEGVTRCSGTLRRNSEAALKLVLWDIDHTLIATHGVGRELFGKCFEHVTGVRMEQQAAVD